MAVILLCIESFWITSMKLSSKGDYVQESQKLTRFIKRMLTRRFSQYKFFKQHMFPRALFKDLGYSPLFNIYRVSVAMNLSFLFQHNISLISLTLVIITLK